MFRKPGDFWRDALAISGSATPHVFRSVLVFGLFAALVVAVDIASGHSPELEIEVAPYEVTGAALGLILVLRTNAGYERWWEARKLWGGIVNRCRHLAIVAAAYGPRDEAWRNSVIRLAAALPHAVRRNLQGDCDSADIERLLGPETAGDVVAARNRPLALVQAIADMFRAACDDHGMDRFAFLEADRDLTALTDYFGGCERILKAPIPRGYTILMRRFIIMFLGAIPFALVMKLVWLTPAVTMFIAYPILSLDKIGDELQNPFSPRNLNHLPLADICRTIEDDLLGMIEAPPYHADDSFRLAGADPSTRSDPRP
ncbi:MAG: hypothetical protein BGO49_26265 [Planctomycetales bacterium 71-10]|nr:MAG: hypothetical protein BGO49_26265 [Planctomycetales bacterium 71-10]